MATPIPPNQAKFSAEELLIASGGTLVRPGPASAVGVVADSRAVQPGNVFVALRGDAHDAHAFLDAACRGKPSYVIVERGRAPWDESVGVIEVDDTLVALGQLASFHLALWRRGSRERRVVAITGSAGKTTTKELTAALLTAVAPTHFTAGNLNNRIGVPFVVLGIQERHRFAVLEMGMSLPGELAAITRIAPPDVGLVTNIGVAHAEGVGGGREAIADEKGAVYRALGEDGIAIVNADDPFAPRAETGAVARTRLSFGRASATYQLVRRDPSSAGGSRVVLDCPQRQLELHLPLPGEVAAIDLAAALAAQEAASGVRLLPDRIDAALATVSLDGRASLRQLGGDILLLDDTYNANPASMRSALATLGEIAGARRRVAVLGEMKELGGHAEPEHAALGDVIAAAGVTLAIGCGGLISRALVRAAELGVTCVDAVSTEEAARELVARASSSDAVLVKGSRSVGAEKVVAALLEAWPGAPKSASSGPV